MTSLVSVRLSDELLQTMRTQAQLLHLSQTDYIRQAIEHMNHETQLQLRKQRLERASLRVRGESMKINAELSDIDHDPEA